ncbi:hypothetical protein PAECIP111893_04970 [Paenibacillus plantiphilus]|uniref:Uncharacterized protein n=1 Tax=Paenibacillus plantiphilus TaxID=2905650 RepID=A0ABN8H0F8_9BACL|nr:hypothetical protein PAECIP111893_04970 [Paenibacillus plantiphilus]
MTKVEGIGSGKRLGSSAVLQKGTIEFDVTGLNVGLYCKSHTVEKVNPD